MSSLTITRVNSVYHPARKVLRKVCHYFVFIMFASTSMATVAETGTNGSLISITSNPDNKTLMLAYSQALFQLNMEDNSRELIPLPQSVITLTGVAVNNENGEIFIATQTQGVLTSSNHGKSWEPRNNGLASRTITALTQHAQQPETLYAIDPTQGIYHTEDAGKNWLLVDGGPPEMNNVIIHSDMPDSMQTGWIFTATSNGVSRSMDCFCLWSQAGELQGEITALSYDPQLPKQIYAATDKSIFLTKDGGQNWTQISVLKSTFSALHITDSGIIYAGTQNGKLMKSADKAQDWDVIDGK
ncbi:hypothetical protein HWV00_08330 [Moritella sp. 24]|uniref:WD40/YVTN/BNR-like repeat-containing protein n=1 Tax=Moritella sp. 24 TaxID=2746230 RepID=UPI001BA584D3|nr:hypothetical protein [Moritella sp. 24]QUM76225.1 hypothetical protein HWV00_08330 [Moritella sp. 24]